MMRSKFFQRSLSLVLPLIVLAGCSDDSSTGGTPPAGTAGSAQGGQPGAGKGGTAGTSASGSGGKTTAGSGGSPEAGSGGSPEAGSGGSPEAGSGGSTTAGSGGAAPGGACCEATEKPGCADAKIQDCVCAMDPYCCGQDPENGGGSWDSVCVKQIATLQCGAACPGTCSTDKDCTDTTKPLCKSGACSAKCTKDDECSFGQKCDTASGKCGECFANADCTGDTEKLCNLETRTCAACVTNTDCTAPAVCDAGKCVECKADADCKDAAKNVCNSSGKCVGKGNCCEATSGVSGCTDTKVQDCVCAMDDFCCKNSWDSTCVKEVAKFMCGAACPGTCNTDGDCKDATKPICDSGLCKAKCTKDDECGFGEVCDETSGKCGQCFASADCKSATKPICSTTDNKCVGCLANTDCKDAASPLCDPERGACVTCVADTDCKTGTASKCDFGKCVECKADTDCKDATKNVCSSSGTCVGKGNCCEATDGVAGCTDTKLQDCVCAMDPYCCGMDPDNGGGDWDSVCVTNVAKFMCGTCPSTP